MNEKSHSDSRESPGDTITSKLIKPLLKRFGSRRVQVIAGILGVCILVFSLLLGSGDSPDQVSTSATARVQAGPLVVTVTETGELEAERQKIISNELQWPVIIRSMVDEGTLVTEGQTIIEFECKELIDAIVEEEMQVTVAQNDYTQASQSLKLKKDEMANKVLKAKREMEEAKENRTRYIKHEYEIELADRENAVNIAKQQLELAQEKLAFKKKVNKMPDLESPFSMNDIRAEELKVQQLENSLKKADLTLDKFKEYDHKRKLRELDEDVADSELRLRRSELEAQNQVLIAEANAQAKKYRLEMRTKRLKELKEDEQKLIVKAEESGLVVYDSGRRRWQSELVIAVGEKISPRQQLMIIPDMSSLQITTKVYEAMIEQVKPGLPAYIRLDAKPDVTLSGKVAKVAPLPDSQNRWLNPGVKVFNVTVAFEDGVNREGLKPGMTAQVELVLAELPDVLSVPIAAVFSEQERTFCYVKKGGKSKTVDVKVGRMNDRRVQIVSGLEAGLEILLAPPEAGTELEQKGPKAQPGPKSPGNRENRNRGNRKAGGG